MIIRAATYNDLQAINDIHNDILLNTTAIWDETPETIGERHRWLDARLAKNFPVLVGDKGGTIAAFASYGTWRERCGYINTVEHTVHVHKNFRGQGLGRALVLKLLSIAKSQARHVMLGGMSGDNESSIAFHKRLGFYEGARLKEVGYKFGRRLDLVFMQKIIDS